jgi:hypothetical protein
MSLASWLTAKKTFVVVSHRLCLLQFRAEEECSKLFVSLWHGAIYFVSVALVNNN